MGFDLRAVPDDHDLHVGGVKIFSRGGHQIGGSDGADFVAIGFEVVGGKFVELDRGELGEQAFLCG